MGGPGSGRKGDPARDAIIARLRGEGLTLTEIGQRVGLTRQMVKNIRDRLGLPVPAAGRPTGFALLSAEQRRKVARKGGKAARGAGAGHRFTPAEARAAVQKRWRM